MRTISLRSAQAEALFETMAGQHRRIVGRGDAPELSKVCWAFATLGCEGKTLFDTVGSQVERFIKCSR